MSRGGALDDLLAELDEVPAAIVRDAAVRFAELAHAEARRTPWHRYGRMDTKPERLTVTSGSASLRIVGIPAAIWAWAEHGINPHVIRRRAAARSRRGRSGSAPGRGRSRAVLNLTSGPVMGPVKHPGYRTLGAWSAAADALEGEAAQIASQALEAL